MMNFFKKIWQVWFYQWSLPLKLASIGILISLILVVVLCFRLSRKPEVKIDESSLQKINQANEAARKAELEKIIVENSEVVKTVDQRTEIAETNTVERNRLIDEKIAEVNRKISEAKKEGKDVSGEELECLLIPENCN